MRRHDKSLGRRIQGEKKKMSAIVTNVKKNLFKAFSFQRTCNKQELTVRGTVPFFN